MSHNRYDSLREKVAKDFERTKTYAPALAAGETIVFFDLNRPGETGENMLEARFEKYGPFNRLFVDNETSEDLRLYFSPDRASAYHTMPGTKDVLDSDTVPYRYIRYFAVENVGTGDIAAGDLEIHIGNQVDSVELDLLKMAGQLDVQG